MLHAKVAHSLSWSRCTSLIVLLSALAACQPSIQQQDFIGQWKSSKLETPLYLYRDGAWEIRTEEGGVLQYGVWRYEDGKMIWVVKQDGQTLQDVNPVVKSDSGRFQLKEADGSITTFIRIGDAFRP